MGSDAKKGYNAQGRAELLMFQPEDLTVVDDPAHPLYDDRVHLPLDEALVLNIMANGVLEPVLVRKNGERDDLPVVEVVAGRQRVRAACEANRRLAKEGKQLVRVPGVPRRGDDADLFGVMVSENEVRRGDSPIVRAKKLQRYLAMGRTQADAACMWGVNISTVGNMLALLDCAAPVQKAVEAGTIGATLAAKELSRLPREQQEGALAKLVAEGATKGEAAKETVQRIRGANGHASGPKMRPRKTVEAWRKALSKLDRRDATIACAVLAYVLGHDRALGAYPELQEALGE